MGKVADIVRTVPILGPAFAGQAPIKTKLPKIQAQKSEAKQSPTLQAARSRDDRLQGSKGRSSFRIDLLDNDDRSTRTGISLN